MKKKKDFLFKHNVFLGKSRDLKKEKENGLFEENFCEEHPLFSLGHIFPQRFESLRDGN